MAERSAETGDLAERMDTGIGSTCPHDMDTLPDNTRDRFLQRSLNGRHSWLDLPAMIVGPVVFDRQFKGRHHTLKSRQG